MDLPRLGQGVTYIDSSGRQKAALVVATPESVDPGHAVEVPQPNTVHLAVFSPSGAVYGRDHIAAYSEENPTQAFRL